MGTIINAKVRTCWELFKMGRFKVPWHQRYYDWKPHHVRELLQDINEAVEEGRNCYFLGAIILVKSEDIHWEINDGQQRMMTLSLICAKLCREFECRSDSQREGRALRILFDLDDGTQCSLAEAGDYIPRITPPQTDEIWYKQIIRGNEIGTNGTITAAWKEVDSFFDSKPAEEYNKYFDFIVKKLEIACLQVPETIDANAVYETINCRGKELDDLDLIRNHLYSYFKNKDDQKRKNLVHENLERILKVIPKKPRASVHPSEYMRCYLQCLFGFLRKDSFYRDVRRKIRDHVQEANIAVFTDYIFELTEKLSAQENLILFSETITSPNPNLLFTQRFKTASKTNKDFRNIAIFIRELQDYSVTRPLVFALLTLYLRETDTKRKKQVARKVHNNLNRLTTFVLRTAFVAPKFEPSPFEKKFSDFAKYIMEADQTPDEKFVRFIKDCDRVSYNILDDSNFLERVSQVQLNIQGNTKRIKQFLLGINSILQNDPEVLNPRKCTIEHILPQSKKHWNNWTDFRDIDANDWINRIGNLTLLGSSDNKSGPSYNGSFIRKKEVYQRSELAITQNIDQYSNWNPESIENRQLEMARLAVKVWSFDQ